MNKPYFVMLWTPGDRAVPLMDGKIPGGEELAWFATIPEATEAAENTPLGESCGYRIFNMLTGEAL